MWVFFVKDFLFLRRELPRIVGKKVVFLDLVMLETIHERIIRR